MDPSTAEGPRSASKQGTRRASLDMLGESCKGAHRRRTLRRSKSVNCIAIQQRLVAFSLLSLPTSMAQVLPNGQPPPSPTPEWTGEPDVEAAPTPARAAVDRRLRRPRWTHG